MSNEVDIRENDILLRDPVLLETLLIDRSRPKKGKSNGHIIWATDNYESLGPGYGENEQIKAPSISGTNGNIIQPCVKKTKEEQQSRARDKGEVFTPSWICNAQNNLIDDEWFGNDHPFNEETDKGWITKERPVPFPTEKGYTWQDYVNDTRLEITCGEAPYLISRYDTITGDIIPVKDRIGLLDMKLRVVGENTDTKEEWYEWTLKAYKATYAYECQGDNLLLAVETERRYELAFDGHRFNDIIRTGRAAEVFGAYDPVFKNPNYWVLPFPNNAILADPDLEQNPE